MRDKLLQIIKDNNKRMNPTEIMEHIKKDYSVSELREVVHELDLMCRDSILRVSHGNTYVLNDLLTGVLDVHEKGNAHLLIKDGEDIFIARNNLKGAYDKDTVLVEYISKDKGEGRVVKILSRSLGRSLGEIVDNDGKLSVACLDKKLPYEVVVDLDECNFTLVDGLIVHLAYVKDISRGKVLAKIDRIIGHKNAPGNETEIAMIASEFNVDLFFPEEVKEEAKKFSQNLDPKDIEKEISHGRIDLRGDTTTTIDGKDTKDIDDAVQDEVLPNGNYKVTVDIADVSYYVKMGSAIWKYAEHKGNSDYLANKVGPMLPVELSNGICSLNPNEDRFAMTCTMEIDHSGRIVNSEVFTSVIKSKKKMNYDAVQDIIENKETEDTKDYTTIKYTVKENESAEDIAFKNCITVDRLLEFNKSDDIKPGNEINIPVRDVIKLMSKISKIMGSRLEKRGKINFESSEQKQIFDENDNIIDVKPRVQREAEELIENHMIFANEGFTIYTCTMLSTIFPRMVPFVFRIHEQPNPKKIDDFMNMLSVFGINYPRKINSDNVSSKDIQELLGYLSEKDNFRILSKKLLRSMQKARYSPDNMGHFGIASENYCHFTSPIRRMADLLVHTIFRTFIVDHDDSDATARFWSSYLPEVCDHISECEKVSAECEYAVDDYYNAKYMEDKIGQVFEATIDGTMNGCFFVETNDKYIEGRVDYIINREDSLLLKDMTDKNEIEQFIETHIKPFDFDYNENVYGYTRRGRVVYRYGDKILVQCIGSNPELREIDFALVGKL